MSDQVTLDAAEKIREALRIREDIVSRINLLKDAKINVIPLQNDLSALDLKIADWKNALIKRGVKL